MRTNWIGYAAAALSGAGVMWLAGQTAAPEKVVLENARVKVRTITHEGNATRPRHIREADQVIVFLEDSAYLRKDPDSGKVEIRKREAGEVIWHSKGEVAPELTNVSARPYRTVVVELK
jgi:hypothetical protein